MPIRATPFIWRDPSSLPLADEADQIAQLLETAARCLRQGRLDSAAWRIADAGGLLRQRMAKDEWPAPGLTLRGAELPTLRR